VIASGEGFLTPSPGGVQGVTWRSCRSFEKDGLITRGLGCPCSYLSDADFHISACDHGAICVHGVRASAALRSDRTLQPRGWELRPSVRFACRGCARSQSSAQDRRSGAARHAPSARSASDCRKDPISPNQRQQRRRRLRIDPASWQPPSAPGDAGRMPGRCDRKMASSRTAMPTSGRIFHRQGWGRPTEVAYQQMKKRTARPRDWSEAEKRQLVKLVRDGMGTRAIAAALGRRANSVRMMAREMKLILRKKAKRPSG
jgi:hypothetical protein